ncbi:hypothetical protein [Microbacterium maritypicum]|uniref:hypothetical protein n=1 Tax=Microbacterium maritypicum TaxID=33918 RepID=UPI003814F2E1
MTRKNQFEIGVAMDTDGVEKSVTNGLVKPLDKAADAFDELEKAANSADLDKELTKAQKATDKLDDELDDTRDAIKRLGFAARDAGDDSKRGMDRAEEGVKEFGEEANSTAKEAAASFDGSAESILDAFQEVAANAFAGFGPAGALAGLAIAAGIGIAVGQFQAAEEAAEELRERAREFAADAVNAGQSTDAWLSGAAQIVDRIQELEQLKATDWRWFWEKDPTQLQEWTDGLRGAGRGLEELEGFLASSRDAQEGYRDSIQDARDATMDQANALAEVTALADEAGMSKVRALEDEVSAYDDVLQAIDTEMSTREEAAASAARQRDAGIESAQARMKAEEEAASRIQSAQESVEQSALSGYDTMRNAAYEKATADDAAFDVGKWLAYVEETRALADSYKANLAAMKLTPAEWENFLALPEDARNSIAASFATAGEDGKERIRSALSDGGSTAGAEATVKFDDAFNPEASVDVDVQADTSDVDGALDDATEDRDVTIKANLTGEGTVRDGLDTLTKRRTVHVEAVLDTSQAARDLASWRRSEANRPITITAKLVKEGAWQ